MGWGDSVTHGHSTIRTPNLITVFRGEWNLHNYSRMLFTVLLGILTGPDLPERCIICPECIRLHLRDRKLPISSCLRKSVIRPVISVNAFSSKPSLTIQSSPPPPNMGYDYWVYTHINADPSHKQLGNFCWWVSPWQGRYLFRSVCSRRGGYGWATTRINRSLVGMAA